MNNNELTFLQKIEEKVNEQRKEREKIKTNLIDSIYEIVDEVMDNHEASQYISKLENKFRISLMDYKFFMMNTSC